MTEEALRQRYEEFLKAKPPEPEVHARHILVETEEEAKEIIKQLDGGADFVAIAKEKSNSPSATQRRRSRLFHPQGNGARIRRGGLRHEEGRVEHGAGEDPVRLARHQGRRSPRTPAADFEEAKPQLEDELQQQLVTALIEDAAQPAPRSRSSIPTARRSTAAPPAGAAAPADGTAPVEGTGAPPAAAPAPQPARIRDGRAGNGEGRRRSGKHAAKPSLRRSRPPGCRTCRRSPACGWPRPPAGSATRAAPMSA